MQRKPMKCKYIVAKDWNLNTERFELSVAAMCMYIKDCTVNSASAMCMYIRTLF